jgi:hypothetical protein
LLLMLCSAPAGAQTPTLGRIRGVVFDSLAKRPLVGATVLVSGSARIGVTDDRGRFEVDSVAVGRRTVTFSTPSLDSLGLFTLGRDVNVVAGQSVELALHTPSFATVWRSLCPNTVASRGDSGIVYGSITNAANEQRLEGARVYASWWTIGAEGKKVAYSRPVINARSDSAGNYYACGVSTDMQLLIEVSASQFAAGDAEVLLGATRVSRRDFLVSAELRVPPMETTVRSSSRTGAPIVQATRRARGTATLRGVVRDAKGQPVAGALITLPAADTSGRSDASGRFVIAHLPAGTQPARVLRLGNGPLSSQIDLRPGQTLEVVFDLPPATVLAKVDVLADREVTVQRRAFDERRRTGLGHYLDATQLRGQSDVTGPLRTIPSVMVQKQGFNTSVMIVRGGVGCTPQLFLDNRRSSLDELRMYAPDDLYGVEVYPTAQTTPAEFITPGYNRCGVIVVWTKLGRR